MRTLLTAALLLLPALPLRAERPETAVQAEASDFADQVLLRMGRAGVKPEQLPRDFGPRLRGVVLEAAGLVPGHFLAFASRSGSMSTGEWGEVFGALREGPEAFAAFLRLKEDSRAFPSASGPEDPGSSAVADGGLPPMPASVKARWASGRSVTAGTPISRILGGAASTDFNGNPVSDALGGGDAEGDSGAAVDLRAYRPAPPTPGAPAQGKSLRDLKPLAPR